MEKEKLPMTAVVDRINEAHINVFMNENPEMTDAVLKGDVQKNGLVDSADVSALPAYFASFKTRGKLYSGTGASVSKAIAAVALKNAKSMGVLTVSKGEKSKTKVLTAPQVFRLFSPSRIMREVALKNVSALFGDV